MKYLCSLLFWNLKHSDLRLVQNSHFVVEAYFFFVLRIDGNGKSLSPKNIFSKTSHGSKSLF